MQELIKKIEKTKNAYDISREIDVAAAKLKRGYPVVNTKNTNKAWREYASCIFDFNYDFASCLYDIWTCKFSSPYEITEARRGNKRMFVNGMEKGELYSNTNASIHCDDLSVDLLVSIAEGESFKMPIKEE